MEFGVEGGGGSLRLEVRGLEVRASEVNVQPRGGLHSPRPKSFIALTLKRLKKSSHRPPGSHRSLLHAVSRVLHGVPHVPVFPRR